MNASNNQISIQKYQSAAAHYDESAQFTMPLRRRAVALLHLKPGQTVLDVGAGTGLSYELLLQGVGAQGRLLAFEQSPEMFAQAQQRVARMNWPNVWHVCTAAESVTLPQLSDAVLFNYVHDISRTPEAIERIMQQVKPGARVAMAGMKFFPWWTGPLNILAWMKNRPYNVKATDLWTPWNIVQSYCQDWQIQTTQWGMGYIACGVRR